MDVLLFILVVFVAVAVPLVTLGGAAYTMKNKLTRRRLAHEWDGFHAWADRVGVTPSFPPEDDEWRGTSDLGGFVVDVAVDTNALDRLRATPATLTLRASLTDRAPKNLHVQWNGRWVTSSRPPALHRQFAVRGDEVGVLGFLGRDLAEALTEAVTDTPHWSSVEVTGRMIKFVWVDVFELIGDEGEARARELFERAARVLGQIPARYDAPGLLAARAVDASESDDIRFRAGRALFKKFWKTPTLESFAGRASQMDDTAQIMCALWGVYLDVDLSDDARFELLVGARDISEVSGDADDALVNEYGWRALMDARLPEATRLRAARRALTSPGAPDEPYLVDDALSTLILSKDPGSPRGDALLGPLMTGGWRPEERAALALARAGGARLRKSFVKQLQRLGARSSDAPALAELARANTPGALELLESLRGDAAHGMLSLTADDATRGGLSPSRDHGGLTQYGEDP